MVGDPRTQRLEIRLTEAEMSMLRQVAEDEGLSQADILRQCIRSRYAAKFGEKAPAKKKR